MGTELPWGGPQFVFACRHCGRVWDASVRNADERHAGTSSVGFVKSGASNHIALCADRTPAERRRQNEKDEARWKRHKPSSCTIRNSRTHKGLIDSHHKETNDE